MRIVLGLALWCLLGCLVQAQTPSKTTAKQFLLLSDSFAIDSFVLFKGSIKVNTYTEGIDYRINYLHSAFINLTIPKGTLLQFEYLPIKYPLKKVYRNKDASIIQPEFMASIDPFKFTQKDNSFDPIMRNEGLLTNGSIMRGLSLGNSQNAVVNANLNLQLAGRINNDVDILAAISDDNNPIQPEGNTQELQDFDQVFVQFSKNKNKLVVGDYLMTKPDDSYFLNYYKKSRGLSTQTQFELAKKQQLKVGAQAALARGRFVRNLINGSEGNQGPYRLTGPNGEVFIVIISGTESIYLDGEKLTRGEQNDYTIDYNSGEIVFMPKRLITQYSRIIVEFQYSDRNFARTLFGFNTRYDNAKASVYLNYFTEQDNKNQPFQQSLNDSNKLLLASVGDNLVQAKIPSEKRVMPFDSKKILYRKTDTLTYQGIYVYANNALADSVFYEVRFSYVGFQKGNYKQGVSSANGRVFVWVEPINGLPQGDFEPTIQLIAPNRKQLLTFGTIYRFKPNHILDIEMARSSLDQNLYSEIDKQNDGGNALKIESKNDFVLPKDLWQIKSLVYYEFTDARFKYLERYRNVEFNRIWNRQLSNLNENDSGNKEHILNWRLAIEKSKLGNLYYQLGYYNKGEGSFAGMRHQFGTNLANKNNLLQASVEYLSGKQKAVSSNPKYSNQIQNYQLTYTRTIKQINVGAKLNTEQSAYRNAADSLLSGSYAYKQAGIFVKNKDSLGNLSYFADFNIRLDQLPVGTFFKDHTLAKEAKAGISYLQKNFNKLNIDLAFRDFQLLDSAVNNLKPEQTILSRIEYDYGFLKRFITANTYLQMGSGNELRRDFQFVEVPVGQGVYIWKDFNEDAIQQINEFQSASFADKNLANYIKVYLPSTSLIKVINTQISQTFNINSFSNKRKIGWRGFLNRFSDQAAVRFERKVFAGDLSRSLREVTKLEIPDSQLMNLSSVLRNTVFFNRNNPNFGLDFAWNQQQSKLLQTNGFENRKRTEYGLGARVNLSSNWSLTTSVNQGRRIYASEYFTQNNFDYSYQELKPKLTYQWQQQWRVALNYTYSQSENLPDLGGDKSKLDELGAEVRYSFIKIGVLTCKYSLYQVDFKGNINSPLAYDMLQGLSSGNNQLWSVFLQQRFGQNLQINLSYEGRKSASAPIIHTGKMEARYLF